MSTEATDAGLDTPDEDAAPAREKPRLRVTVASDTKSVEMWVRPTASCDLLRARVAAAFDLAPGAFRLVHGKTELRGAWCLGTAGLRRSALTVLVVGTSTAMRPGAAPANAAAAAPDEDAAPARRLHRAVAASLPPRRRPPARTGPDKPWAAHPWAAGVVPNDGD